MEEVIIKGPQATFQFMLKYKFNVILGDSGEKKTYLCSLVESKAPTIKKSHGNMQLIDNKTWYRIQKENVQEQIYFADESFDELHTKEFAEFVQNNNSRFVVISREAFFMIPYGVDQIYRIKSGKGRLKTIECAYDYHRLQTVRKVERCIIEDEGTGKTFFEDLLSCPVETSKGKEHISVFK